MTVSPTARLVPTIYNMEAAEAASTAATGPVEVCVKVA